jgi:hypothetical protein
MKSIAKTSRGPSLRLRRFLISQILGAVLVLSMLTASGCGSGPVTTTPEQGTMIAVPREASTPLPAYASWIVTGDVPDRHFGFTIAAAGDVNADGYSDVIIGDDRYKQFVGRIYLYTGAANGLGMTPVFTATGETTNNHFGYAIRTAGDPNGDEYDDMVVGAYHWYGFRGRVYLYNGSRADLPGTPALTLTGDAENDYLGRSVAGAGDVNGDGYDDVVMAAQGNDNFTGRVYLYTGGPNGLGSNPIWIATGESAGSSFGRSVGEAGDVNGDGYSDVVIGAPGYNNSTGRVYIYAGGPGGLQASPMLVLTGEQQEHFGWAVAGAGDFNGDGYDDVIVGADRFNKLTGRIYVYPGTPNGLSAKAVVTFIGEGPDNFFGHSVAGVGDINADGFDDFLVGAYGYDSSRGRVYLYLGKGGAGPD